MRIDATLLSWAHEQLQDCRLCPRNCRVNRLAGERGYCGAGAEVRYFMEYVGYGEEPELTPSHTLFLSNCNMDCLWCHTAPEQKVNAHRPLTAETFAEIIESGRREGAKNLNLLGGEPVVNLGGLLPLFASIDNLPPIVWNSNLYCSAEALAALDKLVYLYAVDFKLYAGECAAGLAATPDYPETVKRRMAELYTRHPDRILFRHLVMPGHFSCCTEPILRWIADHTPNIRLSLQDYIPMPRARRDRDLGKFLPPEEMRRARKLAENLGIEIVERLPVQTANPADSIHDQLNLGKKTDSDKDMNVELILSPEGKVYLRHPNRPAAELAADVLNCINTPEEKE